MFSFFFMVWIFVSAWDQIYSQESSLPKSTFSCQGREPGYYADVETGCKTYHVCDGLSQFSYVCPHRTLFQQETRICDHWYRVKCKKSPNENPGNPEKEKAESVDSVFNNSLDSSVALDSLDVPDGFNDESDEQNESETLRNWPENSYPTTTTTTTITTIQLSTESEYDKPESTTITTTPEPDTTTFNAPTSTEDEKFEAETFSTKPPPPPPLGKILKLRKKDFRFLFYIPEVGNEAPATKSPAELILSPPKPVNMKFREENLEKTKHSCPAYCDPIFFVPGTCHPCLMIK